MSNALTSGRQPLQVVEIDQDMCSRTFGVAPCTANGTPCYNTLKSCGDSQAFSLGAPLTLRFCTAGQAIPQDAGYVMPFLLSVDTTPTRINPGGTGKSASPFGERATASIVMLDSQHSGNLVDPYNASRSTSPLSLSTFWATWLARNPYYAGRAVRIKTGYIGMPFAQYRTRHYVLDAITADPDKQKVTIKAKDVLKLAADDRAVCPKPTKAVLSADITASQNSLTLTGITAADIPAAGTLRIGSECLTYTARTYDSLTTLVTVTGITRGTDGTLAAAHRNKDSAQLCLRIELANPWELAATLLTDYAGIPPAKLDDWQDEGDNWLSQFKVSALITEPVGVTSLLGELCQQVLMYIWWDEVAGLIKLAAVKPVSSPDSTLSDERHILAGSISIRELSDQRITQVWVFYGQVDPTRKLDEPTNYRSMRVRLDEDAESAEQYNDQRIFKLYSRWIPTDAIALSVASRYIARFRTAPRRLALQVDAKDIDTLAVGRTADVSTRFIVDVHGQTLPVRCEILSADESKAGHAMTLELQTTEFEGSVIMRYSYIMDGAAPDYDAATPTQRNNGCWIAGANGLMPNGDDAYLII